MVGIPELGTSEYTARVRHFLDAETCEFSQVPSLPMAWD